MASVTIVALPRRGRPPRLVEGRPERCPENHPGRVIFWGRRHWTSAPFRRQRMRSYPTDGSPIHTFSLDRRQNEPHHQHGEDCPTCDVRPGAAQGPLALVDFFHTATEIARLLQLIGRGLSLRRASEMVRLEAHRYAEDALGMRYASRQCELAARYLDVLGGEIDRALAPARWPRIRATCDKTVAWRCPDDPTHPGYRMSPYARAKVEVGCPICRKRRRAEAKRAA